MRSLRNLGTGWGTRSAARFRPPPTSVLVYLGIVLALELVAEFWLADMTPIERAVKNWSLLALTVAPIFGLIAWRGCQADDELAAGAAREVVRKLALSLAAENDPERVPALMLQQVRELSGVRLVFLARPDAGAFRVEAVSGDDPHRLLGQALPISSEAPGLAGQALRSGKAALLANTWCEAGLASRRELALSDRVRSAAVLPLLMRGEVVALIGLHADAVQPLNPGQAELLGLYAEQAASAFENALLAANASRAEAAEALDRQKTEFLTAVAHELRGPLTPLMGWSELLLTRQYSAEQARPLLENLHEVAGHLSLLVDDLVDLSCGEAGRLALETKELDLGEVLESAVRRWREQAPQHHFTLALSGPLPIEADSNRLRQVLDNLLSNAVKYSPAGTRIFLTARADPGGRVLVRISDQGLGLTREERDQLFTKFYRADSARKYASGTGLGLALCRLILQAHGGEIGVESEGPGLGSAFTFSLPAQGTETWSGETGAGLTGRKAQSRAA